MQRIRIAILGYGRSGSTMHAGAIEKNPAFELVAVCDTDPQRRKQAEERSRCRVYEDYSRMLREESLALVSVVTRSDQHCTMACDCLAAGVNVLVTKPWAVSAAEAHRMIAAAKTARKLLLPWLPARWGSDLRRLRELVSAGRIGKVFFVRRAVCSFGTRCDWQTERRHGGGYLLNWGPHIVDPPLVLLGQRVESVYGHLSRVINPGDAEDLFYALLTLEDGSLVQAEYTIATQDLPGWFVQGNRGTIEIRGDRLRLHATVPAKPDDPTQYATMKAAEADICEEKITGTPYGDEHEVYEAIARAVRGEETFPVSPADALELSRVFDAIRASDAGNRVVELGPA